MGELSPGPESRLQALLEPLNEAQRAAVTHREGPLLVVAGPGSGKTRVITHRIAHLVETGTPVDGILALTFTNKAAAEMRERILDLIGFVTPWISTFHSFSARLLRKHIYRLEPFTTEFTIYDADDALGLIKDCIQSLDIASDLLSPRSVRGEISRLKNQGIDDPDSLPPGLEFRERFVRKVYARYQKALEANNALDFDDLLLFLERLFKTQPDLLERYRSQFRQVLVDEYQDTNQVQYRIGRLLADGHKNLCVTGDPDQSIYSWRGADIRNILSFERDFPDARVVLLEQNYRSTRAILAVANESIQHNQERREKKLWTENPAGDPVRVYRFVSGEEEAAEIADLTQRLIEGGQPPASVAIFYRINAMSRELERSLVLAGVPYTVVGAVEFYQRKEIKDLLAYLRLLDNPRDGENLRRIINIPGRRIGKATVEKIFTLAHAEAVAPLEVIRRPDLRGKALSGVSYKRVGEFAALLERLEALRRRREGEGVRPVLEELIEEIGYEAYLREFDAESFEDRRENIAELVNAAREYDDRAQATASLTGFLEEVALLAGVDRWDPRADRVSLMTLHSAKGLEFPVVIIAAVEEGLLPLSRATTEGQDEEEERRLFYVGLTRAREKLYLTHARQRLRFGSLIPALPSSFLEELLPAVEEGALELDEESRAILDRLHASPRDDDDPDPAVGSRRPGEPGDADASFSVDDWDEEALDEDPYPLGAAVEHETYGEGVIVDSRGLGRRRKLVVEFEGIGRRTLVLGFARLRRV